MAHNNYKMIDEVTLSNFRRFMASGIPLTEFGPAGAFDSKPKARDDEPEDAARGLANILLAVKDALGDEGFKELCAKVCGDEPEEAAEDDEPTSGDPAGQFETPMAREMNQKAQDKKRAKDKKTAKDEPAPFKGEPETKAMDSAGDPRFAFLADAQRVKPARPGNAYGAVSSKAARSGATSASFEAMYPAASKVQVR